MRQTWSLPGKESPPPMKMNSPAPALALLLCFWTGAAAAANGMSVCLAIEDDTARLNCYDGLAAMEADKDDRAPSAGWVLEEWPARMNPAWTDYEVWTVSLNPVPGAGGIPIHPVLALRCEQGQTRVFFDFGRPMAQSRVLVHYRLGSGPIQPGELVAAPDGRRFGLWDSGLSVRFAKALLGSERLRVQVPLQEGDALTAAFEMAGLAEAAAPIREACAWE